MAALARVEDAEFAAVRGAIEVSDPVPSKQVGILEGASYVRTRKGYVGKRPRPWLSLTDEGPGGPAPAPGSPPHIHC